MAVMKTATKLTLLFHYILWYNVYRILCSSKFEQPCNI